VPQRDPVQVLPMLEPMHAVQFLISAASSSEDAVYARILVIGIPPYYVALSPPEIMLRQNTLTHGTRFLVIHITSALRGLRSLSPSMNLCVERPAGTADERATPGIQNHRYITAMDRNRNNLKDGCLFYKAFKLSVKCCPPAAVHSDSGSGGSVT
jgi:hypothetical protein